MRYDTIDLIMDNPSARGGFEQHQEISTTVFCEVRSVGRSESYMAMSAGLTPEYVFRLAHQEDYSGEKTVVFHGSRYKVIRTYADADYIELTVERSDLINE